MDVAMGRRAGAGTLFLEDEREWGPVWYAVEVGTRPQSLLLRVIGNLTPFEPERDPTMAFLQIVEKNERLALRMDADGGEWWLCFLQDTSGSAIDRGGVHPAGPQPKRP